MLWLTAFSYFSYATYDIDAIKALRNIAAIKISSMTCCGGHGDATVDAEVSTLYSSSLAKINAKLGKHWTSVHVDKVWSQVVAGTNYTAHVTGSDGAKATVRIYVPLPHTHEEPSVSAFADGHVDAKTLHH